MVITNDDLRFMKIYENNYGVFYQSIKKVFINGTIAGKECVKKFKDIKEAFKFMYFLDESPKIGANPYGKLMMMGMC